MGILEDMGADAETADDAEVDSGAPKEGAEAVAAEPEKTERVEVTTATVPRRKGVASRIEKTLADLTKTIADNDARFRQDLAARDRTISELTGRFEEARARPAPAAAAATATPDPEALRKAARKALDSQDFDEYQSLTQQAVLAEIERKWGPKLNAPTPAAAQAPLPLPVQAVIMKFPDVVRHPKGVDLAIIEDRRLALDGVPDGPERYHRAFEIAQAQLGKLTPPAFSPSARGVLAGIPPGRNAAGAAGPAEPGVQLTKYELEVAEKCGMSKQEYARFIADAHPDRLQS